VAHEKLSASGLEYGLFAPSNPLFSKGETLDEKIAQYSGYGRSLDQFDPFGSAASLVNSLILVR
jgi:hypothetical protein